MKNTPRTPEESAAVREWTKKSLWDLADKLGTKKLGPSAIQKDSYSPSLRELGIEYGSVKNAIRAVGLYPVRPEAEDLVRSLKEFYKEHGISPRMAGAHEGRLPYSATCYLHTFGSWNAALRAAGLETITPTGGKACRSIQSSERDEEMLQYLRDLYGASRILPRSSKHDQSNPRYTVRQYRHIGKWSEIAAMLELGLEEISAAHVRIDTKSAPPPSK